MTRNKITASIAVVAVLVLGAWFFGLFGSTDPAVAELQQMADQAFSQNLTDAQEAQYRDQFRQRMETLTPEQRDAFFDANRDRFMQRMQQRMDEYFAMQPADRQKRLDEILNRMSQPRERGPEAGDNNNGGDRGRGDWGNMTEAQRDERSKRRLDRTSPKMRAQFTEFRKQLEDRAKERGITQLPGWGPDGPRG